MFELVVFYILLFGVVLPVLIAFLIFLFLYIFGNEEQRRDIREMLNMIKQQNKEYCEEAKNKQRCRHSFFHINTTPGPYSLYARRKRKEKKANKWYK